MSDNKESDANLKESGAVPKIPTVDVQEPRRHFNQQHFMFLKEEDLSGKDSDDTESDTETNSESSEESKNYDSTFFFEDLSSDDEVYTIQFPDQLDLDILAQHEFDLEGNVPIVDKDKGDVYSVDTDYDEQVVTCAMPSRQGPKLINLPIKGHVAIIKESNELETVKSEERVKLKDFKKEPVPFPTDLKVRHPLLGVDWKEHIARTNDILSGKKVKRTPDEEEREEALQKLLKKLKSSKQEKEDMAMKANQNEVKDSQEKLSGKLKVEETPVNEQKAINLEKLINKLRITREEDLNQDKDHKEKLPGKLDEETSVRKKRVEASEVSPRKLRSSSKEKNQDKEKLPKKLKMNDSAVGKKEDELKKNYSPMKLRSYQKDTKAKRQTPSPEY